MLALTYRLAPIAFMVAAVMPDSSYSGTYRLEPASQAWVDSDHQGYTTFYVRNLGQVAGRISFPGNQFDPVVIQPGETVELYGRANRPAILVDNNGPARIEVSSRYMDRPRFLP